MKYRWRRGEKVCKIQDQIPHLHFLTSCVQRDSGEAFFLPEPNPIIRNFLHEIEYSSFNCGNYLEVHMEKYVIPQIWN